VKNRLIVLSLFINYFVIAILLNSVGTVILQVQNSYHVTESAASILEACKDLSIAFASFLLASFVLRIGYKRCMLLALATVAVICLIMPQLPVFWMTKLLFVTIGIAFVLIKIPIFASLTLITTSPAQHASTMNFLESFFMVGVLSGYFIFSAFVDDAAPGSLVWLDVYYVLAGLCFTAFVLLLFSPLDESPAHLESNSSVLTDFSTMLRLCLTKLVLLFVICAFLYVLIEQSIMSWLPTFNNVILNLPTSLSIQMASMLAAAYALGRFFAGFALRWLDWFKVLVNCLLAAAILVLISLPLTRLASHGDITGWGSAPLAAFLFPLIGLFLAPIYPAINSLILSELPKHQHAPMAGLIVVFSALGGTTGSFITGTMFELFDGRLAFYCALIPISFLLLALYLFRRETLKSGSGAAQ
jgi:MFS transporter, FHS family, glucose/mannose:H+ symporter